MVFFRIKKNILALLAVFIIAFVFAVPAQAASGDVSYSTFWTSADGIGAKAVAVVNIVLYGAFQLISIVLGIVAKMVDFAIQPTTTITGSLLVQNGWTITRDFANMFFILILLAIALAFILFPRHQVKKALPRLIIIALLINFSLPIAGFLIDVSNVFSDYFVSQATGGVGTISTNIAASLHLQNVFDVQNVGQGSTTPSSFDLQVTAFQILLFGIAFIFMTSVVLLALGLMFLFRIAWLSFLLILLPIILVLSIVQKNLFDRWSRRFLNWTFFGPIALFFIYLSMASFSSIAGSPDANSWLEATSKESSIGLIKYIYQYIVIWMLLLMSLSVSKMISTEGGDYAINMGKKLKGVIAGGTGRALTKGAGRLGGMTARGVKADKGLEKLSSGLAKMPGSRFIGGEWASRRLSNMQKALEKQKLERTTLTQQEKNTADKMSDAQLQDFAKIGGPKAIAYQAMLAKRGKLVKYDVNGNVDKDATTKYVTEILDKAEKFGDKDSFKAISRAHPIVASSREAKKIDNMNDMAAIRKKYGVQGNNIYDLRTAAKTAHNKNSMGSLYLEDLKETWPNLDQEERDMLIDAKIAAGMSEQQAENFDSRGLNDFHNTFIRRGGPRKKSSPGSAVTGDTDVAKALKETNRS